MANSKIIVGIAVVVVILLIAGFALYGMKKGPSNTSNSTAQPNSTTSPNQSNSIQPSYGSAASTGQVNDTGTLLSNQSPPSYP